MSALLHLAEPSAWAEIATAHEPAAGLVRLAPWALPAWAKQYAPGPLRRFASIRSGSHGIPAPGFAGLELAARIYSRGERDRLFDSQFVLRQTSSLWAARRPEVANAERLYAPSLSARRLFTSNQRAEKILLLDLPLLRAMHEDLDSAAAKHPSCAFLRRYRAPGWAIVEQECEIAMADTIIVRGRYARQILVGLGVPDRRIIVQPMPVAAVPACTERVPGQLRVLLAGLAAARHGTQEVLAVLATRPWLRVYVRAGEGAEPRELLEHPQVLRAGVDCLAQVDAVLAPSLAEAYHHDVHVAAASGIPVIATLRGAGSVPHDWLTIELPSSVQRGLACALDALYGSDSARTRGFADAACAG